MGEPWFGAKAYGIGLSPRAPAGWIALLVYVAAMAGAPPLLLRLSAPPWTIPAALAALTAAMLAVALAKSDRRPWRWRWGGR